MTYLAVLGIIVFGSIWLEWGLRTRVLRRGKRVLATLLLALPLFLIWDLYAVAAGHWSFDSDQLVGLTLPGGIPVEELLFFPFVGLAAILTLEAVRSVRQRPLGDEGDTRRVGVAGEEGGEGDGRGGGVAGEEGGEDSGGGGDGDAGDGSRAGAGP